MLCYALFYVVIYFSKKVSNFLELSFIAIFIVQLLWYIVFFDKSTYSINDVSRPAILFLFFASMIFGALLRKGTLSKIQLNVVWQVLLLILITIFYFVSQILVSKVELLYPVQIINQYLAFMLIVALMYLFVNLESTLQKIPNFINKTFSFVSKLTLQIYIVQFFVIRNLEILPFPLNLVTTILGIILLATILYYIDFLIKKFFQRVCKNGKT